MPKPRQAVPGFFWMRGNRGDWQLCRDGATEACIWCGISHPRWLTWAHIHKEDLLLSPDQDWRRVFRLCWRESHGAYAHYQLTTKELLAAEEVWINNPSKRPQTAPARHRADATRDPRLRMDRRAVGATAAVGAHAPRLKRAVGELRMTIPLPPISAPQRIDIQSTQPALLRIDAMPVMRGATSRRREVQ